MTKPHQLPSVSTPHRSSLLDIASNWYCTVNVDALKQLMHDDLQKRRRIYLEFKSLDKERIFNDLSRAGFSMETLRRLKAMKSRRRMSCLITGSVKAIMQFLHKNPDVVHVSIDLPEYSWLSSSSSEDFHDGKAMVFNPA